MLKIDWLYKCATQQKPNFEQAPATKFSYLYKTKAAHWTAFEKIY